MRTTWPNTLMICICLALQWACATKPEIPDREVVTKGAPSKKAEKLLDEETMRDLRHSKRWQNAVNRRIASRIRQVRQSCKVYDKPTLMGSSVATLSEGRDVWTEETDTSWFKVYQDKTYGYASKICF